MSKYKTNLNFDKYITNHAGYQIEKFEEKLKDLQDEFDLFLGNLNSNDLIARQDAIQGLANINFNMIRLQIEMDKTIKNRGEYL